MFDGVTVKTKNSCGICMFEFFIDFKPKRNSIGEMRRLYVYFANESTHKKMSLYIFSISRSMSAIKARANELCVVFMICTLLNNPAKASSFYSVMERTEQT